MRLPKISLWSQDPKINDLILFAQLLEEMLYDYSIDSYKSPFSNPHSLLDELTQTIYEQRNRNKDLKNSDSVIALRDEFLHKISDDPVSIKILSTHGEKNFKTLLNAIKNAKNFEEILALIAPIILLFEEENNYFETTKKELNYYILNPPQDKKIFSLLTRGFVSELITFGFSQQYIYYTTEEYFFGDNPRFLNSANIAENLSNFFNLFKIEERKWEIIARGTKSFARIAPIFNDAKFKITKEKPDLRSDYEFEIRFLNGTLIDSKKNCPYFIIFNDVIAFDINSAKQKVEQYLNLLNSDIKFTTHHLELRWDRRMIGYTEDDIPVLSKLPVSSLAKIPRFKFFFWHEIKDLNDDQISEMIANHLPQLYANLDDDAKYSFYKSMAFHNAATKANEPENQFLNIWIALETLVPIYPDDTIFVKFKNSFEPILSTGYCEKLIREFQKSLSFYLNNDLSEIFSLLPPSCDEFNDLEKSAAIIISSDDEILKYLEGRINKNPLFFVRMHELKSKFSSANQIKKEISQHQNRISWHLQRMYRVRNKITHKGEKIQNINYLTENLNSYYHVIVNHIDNCASEFDHLKSIESVLAYCNINHATYLSTLNFYKDKPCDLSNLKSLLFNN